MGLLWRHAKYLVIDNFPAAVVGTDPLHPILTRGFLEYAQHRGFIPDPARAGHPKDKPKVERKVPYARERFFKGSDFDDFIHVRAAPKWCLEVAGMRIHGTTHKQPLVIFQDEERHTLLPWDGVPYEITNWRTNTVHQDFHIKCLDALYSVPSHLCRPGQKVEVRVDSKLVRIYHRGQLIKTHPRQPKGGRSTDVADYPPRIAPYTTRAPDGLKREAAKLGPAVGEFAQRLFEGDHPWSKIRQGHKLLRLGDRYTAAPGRRLSAGPGRRPHRRVPRGAHPGPGFGRGNHVPTAPTPAAPAASPARMRLRPKRPVPPEVGLRRLYP